MSGVDFHSQIRFSTILIEYRVFQDATNFQIYK
jgi:hypothetical protein